MRPELLNKVRERVCALRPEYLSALSRTLLERQRDRETERQRDRECVLRQYVITCVLSTRHYLTPQIECNGNGRERERVCVLCSVLTCAVSCRH